MTDSKGRAANLDRRSLIAGLGSAAVLPMAAHATGSDADLLATERRLTALLRRRDDAHAANAAAVEDYRALCRQRPFRLGKPGRDAPAILARAECDADLRRSQAEWARHDASLRRRIGCEEFDSAAQAFAEEADTLTARILARPAATEAGLAAKARLAQLTGDPRFAWSVVADAARMAEGVNAA